MANERPPAWTPSSGQIGQVPMSLSQDVDAAGVHPASGYDARTLAAGIVKANQPVINRFVAMQRQHIEIGAKDVHKAVLPLQGMDVYYSHVQGLERMHYHISPEAEAPPLPPLERPPELKVPEIVLPEVPEVKIPEPEVPVVEELIPEGPPVELAPIPLVSIAHVHHKRKHLIVNFSLDNTTTFVPSPPEYTVRAPVTKPPSTVPPDAGGFHESTSIHITVNVAHAIGEKGEDIGQPKMTCSPSSAGGGGFWMGGPQLTFDNTKAPPLKVDGKEVNGFYDVTSIPFKVDGTPLLGPVTAVIGTVHGTFDPDTGEIDWSVFDALYYHVLADGISPVMVQVAAGSITWDKYFIDTHKKKWKAVGANSASVYYINLPSDEVIIESQMLTPSGDLESPEVVVGYGSSLISGADMDD